MKKIKYDLSLSNSIPSSPKLELSLFPFGGTSGKINENIPSNIDANAAM